MNPEPGYTEGARRPIDAATEGGGIEATAASWLTRREAGMTAVERDALRAWLAADSRHARAFARADSARTEFDWPLHTGKIDAVLAGLEVRARRRRHRRSVAAAALAVILLTGVTWRWLHPSPTAAESTRPSIVVAVQPERQILPDGSIVEIKGGAEIAVDYGSEIRLVTLLRGTAHFQVAKNSARPFVVRASGRAVRAVGTAFTVELGAGEITVLVTEGTVAVDEPATGRDGGHAAAPETSVAATVPPTLVEAGHSIRWEVSAQLARQPVVRATPETEFEQRLAWRFPRLEFSGAPLGEVVAMFNRQAAGRQHAQLVVADPALVGLKLSGALRADKVEALVLMLETDFQVKAERRGAEIVLRRTSTSPRPE